LRIAGIYYEESFDFAVLQSIQSSLVIPERTAPGYVTILELMEAAYKKPGKHKSDFTYAYERRTDLAGTTFLSLTSAGVRHGKPIKRSLGANQRDAGMYQLTELTIPFGVVAWQYYVYDEKGVSVSQLQPPKPPDRAFSPPENPLGKGFIGFDQEEIKDNYQVIWRQVAILRQPIIK
jgi:hypothetical protein